MTSNNIIYGSMIFLAGLVGAITIVWYPLFFFIFLSGAVLLVVLFFKTEESLMALVFYLPFQIALNITKSVDLASSRFFISALFLVWIIKSLAKKSLDIPNKPITRLILVFLFLASLSAIFSIDQERSFVRLLYFFSIIPIYFIVADYLNSAIKILKIAYILLFSAAIAALAGIAQFLSQFIFGIDAIMDFWSKNIAYLFYGQSFGKVVIANPSWLVNIGGETIFRAISFFPDPHMFAFYLGLVAPIAFSLALFANIFTFSFWQKTALYTCNAILFLALGLTFSRAGYIGAFFGVVAAVFLGWQYFEKKTRFVIITFSLACFIMIFSSSNVVISRFFSSFNPAEGSNSERLLNWRQAVKIIEDYPVTGVGVGAYSKALNARALERSSVSAHNTYLDIAAEMGIGALVIWIIILILATKNFLSVIRLKESELSKEKVISLGMTGAFVWFSVQMFFDTAIYSSTLLAIFMVYLAISVNLTDSLREGLQENNQPIGEARKIQLK